MILRMVSERSGLILKQGEWNLLEMGTTKYETNCKRVRFNDIKIEIIESTIEKIIPLMNDKVADVSFEGFNEVGRITGHTGVHTIATFFIIGLDMRYHMTALMITMGTQYECNFD